MKIAAGMIVFNGNYVLQECLESIYPFVDQILVAEGPVQYWRDQGHTQSTDGTIDVLHNFPDPDKKIRVIHSSIWSEKDEMCNHYMGFLNDDIDYIWNVDSDEIFKPEDIKVVLQLLEQEQYTSVGFKSYTFYGGFDHYLTGFEEAHQFLRIYKVYPGSYWSTHRPPTIAHVMPPNVPNKHLTSERLWKDYGVRMYHYSYVFPQQVLDKIQYYKESVSKDNCLMDYFMGIYLPWVTHPEVRNEIEKEFRGVHEFKPEYRGDCFTTEFTGQHPMIIENNMEKLKTKFNDQLERCRQSV